MDKKYEILINDWRSEEQAAHIHGWDFSHIGDRYKEEDGLPWSYDKVVKSYLKSDMVLLDYDAGGGEYLLSLGHPYENTAATEGFAPNVSLCESVLTPLGIDFKPCNDPSRIPYPDSHFDIIINRHGDFDPKEIKRLLKSGGIFITEQVGSENDRDLVLRVLPNAEKPFPNNNLSAQREEFEKVGFEILRAEEAFGRVEFYDVGAFVWFAKIIEWEFSGFSVDKCLPQLLDMQKSLADEGKIVGKTHRFLLAARAK